MASGAGDAPSADPLKTAIALRKQGDRPQMLLLLRAALRREQLADEQITRAGSLVHDALAHETGLPSILLAGQCTTAWLATTMTAVAWGRGMPVRVVEGRYDVVLQDLHELKTWTDAPAAVVLLPWNSRLLGDATRSARQRMDEELDFWRHAWEVARCVPARLIQVGYDWTGPGAAGYHLAARQDGDVAIVRGLNAELREALPHDAYFVDLEQIAGEVGRSHFYDARQYAWTKQPFRSAGVVRLAAHLVAAYRALTAGPKKVLVVDLDNTLWGGVVGETGPLGIEIGETPAGEAFLAIQRYLAALSRRGVLLAACTRNNLDEAREPFLTNPSMVLRLDDFAAFEAGWGAKPDGLLRISRQLNLDPDSFVFLDDNPVEREHVRQALPDVEVVEPPDDPADWVAALERGLWFESMGTTEEDLTRGEAYRAESARRAHRAPAATLDEYLASLEMRADIRDLDGADLPRAVQLIGKTNQFNLTSRRHSRGAVLALLSAAGTIALTERVSDRFGDHGLVAVLIGVAGTEATVRIDTWLMSCRVIGRTAEHRLFAAFLARAAAAGYARIEAEYVPTVKNQLVRGLLESLGFTRVAIDAAGAIRYDLALTDARAPQSWVRSIG